MQPDQSHRISLPADFHHETLSKILAALKREECVQLVGLKGLGKSITMLALSNPDSAIFKHHLQSDRDKYKFVFLDFDLLFDKTAENIFRFISDHLEFNTEFKDQLVVEQIENKLKRLFTNFQKVVLIINKIDYFGLENLKSVCDTLKGFYRQFRPSISFIFITNREKNTYDDIAVFGSLGLMICENIIYLPPLNQKDAFWYMQLLEKRAQKSIPLTIKKKIFQVTGGYTRTIKRLVFAFFTGQNLDLIIEDPESSTQLNYHFDELLADIRPEQETLVRLINNNLLAEDNDNLKKLQQLSILNKDKGFVSLIFKQYVRQKLLKNNYQEAIEGIRLNKKLTKNEFTALQLLLKNRSQIVSREALSEYIWGQNACLDITNHAIDQLLHRLTKKIIGSQPKMELETVRGRGHRLTIII